MDKDLNYINSQENDDIDLRFVFSLIKRNKYFIFSFSTIFFILVCLYSFTLKKVWEGRFQIVLKTENDSRAGILNETLGGLDNFASILGDKNNSSLKTEVGILESPSVLMPIFDYVKGSRKDFDPKKNISFTDWKNENLNILLKKGTSILDISYRDTDRDIIIPVLKKMSDIYQDYSGRNQKRGLELAKNYVNKQINVFKQKSSSSIKIAQQYAIDQDLTILDLTPSNLNGYQNQALKLPNNISSLSGTYSNGSFNNTNDYIGNIVSVEAARVEAANEIRRIDAQIKKIKKLENDDERIKFYSQTNPQLNVGGTQQELDRIETMILDIRSKYTEEYPRLKTLEEKRRILLSSLKQNTINYLLAKKSEAESRVESATRPKGVLLRYKELIREANRDEDTLIQLENQLRVIILEESIINDPWELITKPTLKEFPVAPSKKIIGLFGLLSGFLLSVLVSFLKEKKSGLIFDEKDLEKQLNSKIIEMIDLNNIDQEINSKILFISDFIKKIQCEKVRFILSKNLNKDIANKFKKVITKKITIPISYDYLHNISKKESKLLILDSKASTYKEITDIKNQLHILQEVLDGIIIIKY